MTPEEFIRALRKSVLEPAVTGTLDVARRPPGRRPDRKLIKMSEWYLQLSDEDRSYLHTMLELAAHQSLFGLLAVIDGARTVEDADEKGEFELRYRKRDQEWIINPPDGAQLHDLLNQELIT